MVTRDQDGLSFHDYDGEFEEYLAWYRSLFAGAKPEQLIGEDTTTYLRSPDAPRGIVDCLDQIADDVTFLMEVTKALMLEQGGSVEADVAPFEQRGYRYYAIPNEYNFGFYLLHPTATIDFQEVSYDQIVSGPEPRFDLAITRGDLANPWDGGVPVCCLTAPMRAESMLPCAC